MAEWSIAAVLKTVVGVSPPRVRISAPPPVGFDEIFSSGVIIAVLESWQSWLNAAVSKTVVVVR